MNTEIFLAHHFDISLDESILFEKFLKLFIEYNTHTNLSAIRDEDEIIEKHFLDSLYAAPLIQEILDEKNEISQNITPPSSLKLLDIGSGGGFPGIPLKIIFPYLHVTLLDSVGKKVRAMQHFISNLGLQDISAVQERAEILAKQASYKQEYDFIVSRATAYITDILTWAVPFLKKDGKIFLYKMSSDEETQDRERIVKKLGLHFDGMLEYELAGKKRCIMIFSKK